MGVTYERGAGGHIAERVRPVPSSPEAAALATLAADPASDWRAIPDPEPTEEPPPPPAEPPTKSASKADWVAYAVAQGVDQAEAEASTRDALVERFTEKEAS